MLCEPTKNIQKRIDLSYKGSCANINTQQHTHTHTKPAPKLARSHKNILMRRAIEFLDSRTRVMCFSPPTSEAVVYMLWSHPPYYASILAAASPCISLFYRCATRWLFRPARIAGYITKGGFGGLVVCCCIDRAGWRTTTRTSALILCSLCCIVNVRV